MLRIPNFIVKSTKGVINVAKCEACGRIVCETKCEKCGNELDFIRGDERCGYCFKCYRMYRITIYHFNYKPDEVDAECYCDALHGLTDSGSTIKFLTKEYNKIKTTDEGVPCHRCFLHAMCLNIFKPKPTRRPQDEPIWDDSRTQGG